MPISLMHTVPIRYHELVLTLLKSRGFSDPESIDRFLMPDFVRDTHDPFLMPDMHEAVIRLLKALSDEERIAVYADFDCDGMSSGALMSDFLHKVGHKNFEVYIPHRHDEGHGFHPEAVAKLAKRGVSLIVTVDVGIVAHKTAQLAKKLGIDLIITDHHELPDILPEAIAVINPRRKPYPFPHLCGGATAFKLVQATLIEGRRAGVSAITAIPEGWEKWLLDLVAIATVGDMMPLVDENRALVRFGLMVLRKTPRPGIVALCKKLRIDQRTLTEVDIGFSIAPRLNAASRMDQAEAAFGLLSAREIRGVDVQAAQLEKLNNARKGAVAALVKEVKHRVEERNLHTNQVIVLGDPDWKPALLGLAATNIVEAYGKPACFWGRSGNGVLKGSCRSGGKVNVAMLLASASDVLMEHGGHGASGGFSVAADKVHLLSDALCTYAASVTPELSEDIPASSDTSLSLGDVSPELWQALLPLSPFGIGNPQPSFRLSSVRVRDVKLFGKGQEHTEVLLEDMKGNTLRGIRFFTSPDRFSTPPSPGAHVDVVGMVEKDSFGYSGIRLRVIDIE